MEGIETFHQEIALKMKVVKVWKQGVGRESTCLRLSMKKRGWRKHRQQLHTIWQARFLRQNSTETWQPSTAESLNCRICSHQADSQASTEWLSRHFSKSHADTVVCDVLHSGGISQIDPRFSCLPICHNLRHPCSLTSLSHLLVTHSFHG